MATATFKTETTAVPQGRTSPFDGSFEIVNPVPDPLQPQRIPICIDMTPGASGAVNPGQRNIPTVNGVTWQPPIPQDPKPENHMTLAFLSTLFCACPCGVMSLCHAIQVNSNYQNGNRVGADYNARQAWKWGLASVVLGCLCFLIVIMYYLVFMAVSLDGTT